MTTDEIQSKYPTLYVELPTLPRDPRGNVQTLIVSRDCAYEVVYSGTFVRVDYSDGGKWVVSIPHFDVNESNAMSIIGEVIAALNSARRHVAEHP